MKKTKTVRHKILSAMFTYFFCNWRNFIFTLFLVLINSKSRWILYVMFKEHTIFSYSGDKDVGDKKEKDKKKGE